MRASDGGGSAQDAVTKNCGHYKETTRTQMKNEVLMCARACACEKGLLSSYMGTLECGLEEDGHLCT